MPAAAQERGGQPAGEAFEQRVRTRIVATRREEDVMRAEQVGERSRSERPDDVNALEALLRAAGESEFVGVEVEVLVQPAQDVRALARIVRPARRDHAQAPAVERLARSRWMEDRRVDGVVNHNRIAQLEAELAMLLQAVAGLQDRRVRQRVDLDDPAIGAVVEAAVDADRAVHAVHHPHSLADETA